MNLTLVFKIVGSAIWLIVGLTISLELNKYNKKKLAQSEAFIELMRNIRLKIDCYAIPIPDILTMCDKELLIACGGDHADISSLSRFIDSCNLLIDGDGKKAAIGFCKSIGKGFRDNEVKLCDSYIDEMLIYKNTEAEKLPGILKLCTTLCLCTFCAVLLLII